MFAGVVGWAGSFLSQGTGVKEELFIVHVCWIPLWGRGDLRSAPRRGQGWGWGPQTLVFRAAPPTDLVRKHIPPTGASQGLGPAHRDVCPQTLIRKCAFLTVTSEDPTH